MTYTGNFKDVRFYPILNFGLFWAALLKMSVFYPTRFFVNFGYYQENGVVRGKEWTRQTLSDAWESTNWEGLCGTPVAESGSRIEGDEESHS